MRTTLFILSVFFQLTLCNQLNAQSELPDTTITVPSPLCNNENIAYYSKSSAPVENSPYIHNAHLSAVEGAVYRYDIILNSLPNSILWNPRRRELSYPSIIVEDEVFANRLNELSGLEIGDTSNTFHQFNSNKELMPRSFFIPIHTLDTIVRNVAFFQDSTIQDTIGLGVRLYLGMNEDVVLLGDSVNMSAYIGPAKMSDEEIKDYVFYDEITFDCYLLNLITPCPSACDASSPLNVRF